MPWSVLACSKSVQGERIVLYMAVIVIFLGIALGLFFRVPALLASTAVLAAASIGYGVLSGWDAWWSLAITVAMIVLLQASHFVTLVFHGFVSSRRPSRAPEREARDGGASTSRQTGVKRATALTPSEPSSS